MKRSYELQLSPEVTIPVVVELVLEGGPEIEDCYFYVEAVTMKDGDREIDLNLDGEKFEEIGEHFSDDGDGLYDAWMDYNIGRAEYIHDSMQDRSLLGGII